MNGKTAITKTATIILIAIIVIAAFIAAFYVLTMKSSAKASSGEYKVAYCDGSPTSSPWVIVNKAAINAAAASLNSSSRPIITTFYSGVTETNMDQLVESLAAENYTLIIVGGGFLTDATNTWGPDYPNTQFILQTIIFTPTANVGAIENSGMYPGYFAAGLAAGYASKTHIVGFITAFEVPVLASMYNAYAMGAKAANSATTVDYVAANSWSDPTVGAASADSLIGLGCDVICPVGDGMSAGADTEAAAKGDFSIGYIYNATSIAPNNLLVSVAWNPEPAYRDMMYNGLKGSLYGEIWSQGMSEGAANVILNNNIITKSMTSAQYANLTTTITNLESGNEYIPDIETFP
jgi:simple sugar transport system substrate-binding protein